MANIFINLLPRGVADKYYNIKKLTKQLHKTASTIGFIKKLHSNIIIILHARSIKGFVLVNQSMSVKQN